MAGMALTSCGVCCCAPRPSFQIEPGGQRRATAELCSGGGGGMKLKQALEAFYSLILFEKKALFGGVEWTLDFGSNW